MHTGTGGYTRAAVRAYGLSALHRCRLVCALIIYRFRTCVTDKFRKRSNLISKIDEDFIKRVKLIASEIKMCFDGSSFDACTYFWCFYPVFFETVRNRSAWRFRWSFYSNWRIPFWGENLLGMGVGSSTRYQSMPTYTSTHSRPFLMSVITKLASNAEASKRQSNHRHDEKHLNQRSSLETLPIHCLHFDIISIRVGFRDHMSHHMLVDHQPSALNIVNCFDSDILMPSALSVWHICCLLSLRFANSWLAAMSSVAHNTKGRRRRLKFRFYIFFERFQIE